MNQEEMMEAFENAFCHELEDIKARLNNNGGRFRTCREIDNAKDCIQALCSLKKIEAMESGTKALSR